MLVPTYNHQTLNLDLPSQFDGKNLLALPALVDPHVHFRTPGAEHKENWISGAQAAIAGGYSTVFDMPNNTPAIINHESYIMKHEVIDKQLSKANIPLNYYLYLGATPNNIEEIKNISISQFPNIVGVKLFMGASTGDLLVDKIEDQEKIFQACAENDLVLAVHAESEAVIQENNKTIKQYNNVQDHSKMRPREAAIVAVSQALTLAKKYDTKLYICHVSTKEEVELIKQAKLEGVKVYAEATPHHLFLSEKDYNHLGTLGQMNPPLRTIEDQKALWQAILDGTIDTIGTDHAPHTLEEKARTYPASPSGVPGLETTLPLLLNEYKNGLPFRSSPDLMKNNIRSNTNYLSSTNLQTEAKEGKISLEKIVNLTHFNIQKIFGIPETNDWTIVDLDLEKEVKNENLKTKCDWSPFAGIKLQGWPIVIVLKNKIYLI